MKTTRREFLNAAATVAATPAVARGALSAREARGRRRNATQDEPWFRISLAEWSLHRTLREGDLDHLDFAATARNDYGIDAVEYVNTFFFDRAGDAAYHREMRERADAEGVRSLLIMCDRLGQLGDPDERKRHETVDRHLPWIEAAVALGCHSIRVNAASDGSWDEQSRRAADGLHRLGEAAAAADIDVLVENHGGLSSNGAWLAATIQRADHPRVGTLPDFGNFRLGGDEWYDFYRGVEELMPYARAVSAKSHDFDDAGNETRLDYLRLLRIVRDAGYRGYVGIEYEGSRLSEPEGIRATKALLERVRDALVEVT